MKRKITVSIGIPAHNEENNIVNLLTSIVKQKGNNFILKKIFVVCDGCTDHTALLARKFGGNYKKIKVFEGKRRLGKMARLNEIYEMNNCDILFTFDADVVLKDDSVIKKIVKIFQNDKSVSLVVAHQIPVLPNNFFGKVVYAANRIWEETRIPVNKGDHIHNLQGSATALNKTLTEKIRYPSGLTSDQGYLYMEAKQYGIFKYAHNAAILYRPPDNYYDFRLLASRSIYQDRKTMVDHFGPEVLHEFHIPFEYKLNAISKMIAQSPVYGILSILLNIFVRIFHRKDSAVTSKTWEMAQSARKAIRL